MLSHLAFLALAAASPGVVADPGNDHIIYNPEAFAVYTPATALDMVAHVPGFHIAEGDDRRGYSGALGNVLIDGAHPNSKTQSLSDALQQIPAAQVARVEVWRQADAAGGATQTQLVNVVRVPLAHGGVWSLGTELANSGQPALNGYAAATGRYRQVDYSLGTTTYALHRDLPGSRVVRDANGTILNTIKDISPRVFVQSSLNGDVAGPVFGGRLKANLSAFSSRYRDRSEAVIADAGGLSLENDRNPYGEGHSSREAGLHYDHAVAGGNLTIAALATRKRFDSAITADTLGPAGQLWSRFSQTIRHDSGEDIARGDYTRAFGAHHLTVSAEAATNSLTSAARLSLDLGAGAAPIVIPNANIRIVETRSEVALGDSWTPRPRWTVDGRVAYERSRLTFSGDTQATVSLAYIKPSVQVSRDVGKSQFRLRTARDVGQLNFDDFTSAAAVADGRINGGNPDLRPQTGWHYEFMFDGHFSGETTSSIRVFRDNISNAADLVPIAHGGIVYDAPGNIGRATITGAQVTAHIALTRLLPGGHFDIDTTVRHSSVIDPTTGRARPLSNLANSVVTLSLRQDIPATRLSWGANYTRTARTQQFYAAEVDSHRDSPSLDLFVEARLKGSLKLQAWVKSALGEAETRRRVFYSDRKADAVTRVESRKNLPGHWLYVTLSDTF